MKVIFYHFRFSIIISSLFILSKSPYSLRQKFSNKHQYP
jgi:hypothetical protein